MFSGSSSHSLRPHLPSSRRCRPDHIHRECIQVHRVAEFIWENEPLAWPATSFPVLVKKEFQLSYDRNSALAFRAHRFVDVAPPDGFFNSNFGTVVILPAESRIYQLRNSLPDRPTELSQGPTRKAVTLGTRVAPPRCRAHFNKNVESKIDRLQRIKNHVRQISLVC
jgi:hypothetical protein